MWFWVIDSVDSKQKKKQTDKAQLTTEQIIRNFIKLEISNS